MTTAVSRRFCVHARHLDRHHGRLLHEASFEAAAVAYVEDFGLTLPPGGEVSILVRDLDDGSERCFAIDLASGEAAPCP